MPSGMEAKSDSYLGRTHQPLNCLVFILPMLAAYEIGAFFFPKNLLAPRHLEIVLAHFGASASYLPGVLVVLTLLAWYGFSARREPISGKALAGMAVESLLWMLPMIVLGLVTRRLLSAQGLPLGGRSEAILTGMGAGIYEEFIFRLGAIGLAGLVLTKAVRLPRAAIGLVLALASAVLFGLYHYIGPESFQWRSFSFRVLAGLYLGLVYLARGFGIAVGTHAFYNVYVAWVSAGD